VSEYRPEETISVPPSTTDETEVPRVLALRTQLERDGWTVSAGEPGSGATNLLAERDLRLDLTALRIVHLFQIGFAAEFGGAIAVGFLWPTLGHPVWEGEAITGLAILGAIGLIGILARVDFVSLVLVVERLPERARRGESPDPNRPQTLVWARRTWSRNWEVLGDRGGRRILETRRTPAADAAAEGVVRLLAAPTGTPGS
jgi:hypothetical protein